MMKFKKNFKKDMLIKFLVIMLLLIQILIKFRMIKKKIHFNAAIKISKKSNIYKSKLKQKII